MVDACFRYGLKSFTGVISSLRGVEAIEDKSAYETNISGRTNSRTVVKFPPLLMTFPLGSSHCTARVDVGGRSGSLLVLHISV